MGCKLILFYVLVLFIIFADSYSLNQENKNAQPQDDGQSSDPLTTQSNVNSQPQDDGQSSDSLTIQSNVPWPPLPPWRPNPSFARFNQQYQGPERQNIEINNFGRPANTYGYGKQFNNYNGLPQDTTLRNGYYSQWGQDKTNSGQGTLNWDKVTYLGQDTSLGQDTTNFGQGTTSWGQATNLGQGTSLGQDTTNWGQVTYLAKGTDMGLGTNLGYPVTHSPQNQPPSLYSNANNGPSRRWWNSQGAYQPKLTQINNRLYEASGLVKNNAESYVNQENYGNMPSYIPLSPGLPVSNQEGNYNSFRHGWPPVNQYNQIRKSDYLPWPVPDSQTPQPAVSNMPNEYNELSYLAIDPVPPVIPDDPGLISPEPIIYSSDQDQIVTSEPPIIDQPTNSKRYLIVHANGTHEYVSSLDGIEMDEHGVARIKFKDPPNYLLAIYEVEGIKETDDQTGLEIPYDTGISKIPQDTNDNDNLGILQSSGYTQDSTEDPIRNMNNLKTKYLILIQPASKNIGITNYSSQQALNTHYNRQSNNRNLITSDKIHQNEQSTNDLNYKTPQYIMSAIENTDYSTGATDTTVANSIENSTNSKTDDVTEISTENYTNSTVDISTYTSQDTIRDTNKTKHRDSTNGYQKVVGYYYDDETDDNTEVSQSTTQTNNYKSDSVQQTPDSDIDTTEKRYDTFDTSKTGAVAKGPETANKEDIEFNIQAYYGDSTTGNYNNEEKSSPAPAPLMTSNTKTDSQNEDCLEENDSQAARKPIQLRDDLKIDVSELKTVVDKPVVWFRPDVDFWDKVTKGEQAFDAVSFYNVRCKPMVIERLTTIHHHPNGTETVDYVETVWESPDGMQPKKIKSKREYRTSPENY